jgi:hypothetical protein
MVPFKPVTAEVTMSLQILVMGHREMLGVVVGEVAEPFVPVVFELLLGFAILEPETAHSMSMAFERRCLTVLCRWRCLWRCYCPL